MKYGDFASLVTSFVNRKDVTPTQIDFFVNVGKGELQLTQNFNFTRKKATLIYPTSENVGVALPSDFKGMAGDYSVRFNTDSPSFPAVPIKGSTAINERRRASQSAPLTSTDTALLPVPITTIVSYVDWVNEQPFLFLNPEVAEASLEVSYLSWISDYSSAVADREDFLMKYGYQVLLWNALRVSNRLVKEEERVPIDLQAWQLALMTLVDFDSRIPLEGDQMDLD